MYVRLYKYEKQSVIFIFFFFIIFSNSDKGCDTINTNIYAGNVNWNKTKNNYNEN